MSPTFRSLDETLSRRRTSPTSNSGLMLPLITTDGKTLKKPRLNQITKTKRMNGRMERNELFLKPLTLRIDFLRSLLGRIFSRTVKLTMGKPTPKRDVKPHGREGRNGENQLKSFNGAT